MFGMQDTLKEGSGAFIASEPIAVQNEVVNFVGKDELVDGDTVGAEGIGEARCLLIGDVGVVVPVNEEDG
jgi:hypothetical protein